MKGHRWCFTFRLKTLLGHTSLVFQVTVVTLLRAGDNAAPPDYHASEIGARLYLT